MQLRRSLILLAALALLTAALPAAALASNPIPPGDSGADEYTEGVPGAGGSNAANGGSNAANGGGGGPGSSSGVPSSAYEGVASQGDAGAAAAATLQASSPDSKALNKAIRNGDQSSGQVGSSEEGAGSGSLGNAVSSVVGGSDSGMGLALPVILSLALAIAAAAFIVRRRSGQDPSPG